jgi:hypothetical protein
MGRPLDAGAVAGQLAAEAPAEEVEQLAAGAPEVAVGRAAEAEGPTVVDPAATSSSIALNKSLAAVVHGFSNLQGAGRASKGQAGDSFRRVVRGLQSAAPLTWQTMAAAAAAACFTTAAAA